MLTKKLNRRNFLGIGASIMLGMASIGCEKSPIYYDNFETHPVEQLFLDANGVRITFTDEDKVLQIRKYHEVYHPGGDKFPSNIPKDILNKFTTNFPPEKGVIIIRDLERDETGFANIIDYGYPNFNFKFAEIHIPKDQRLEPGYEIDGGKFHYETPLHEVR